MPRTLLHWKNNYDSKTDGRTLPIYPASFLLRQAACPPSAFPSPRSTQRLHSHQGRPKSSGGIEPIQTHKNKTTQLEFHKNADSRFNACMATTGGGVHKEEGATCTKDKSKTCKNFRSQSNLLQRAPEQSSNTNLAIMLTFPIHHVTQNSKLNF